MLKNEELLIKNKSQRVTPLLAQRITLAGNSHFWRTAVLRDEGGGYEKFIIDRKVYKEHLMAPYSAKRDVHLWVRLLCPSDTSEDFLKEFDAIMTDFQKDVN